MTHKSEITAHDIPVVILAGGTGISLGPQGSTIPKTMVEINGLPLLLHLMDHYGRFGFRKFIICAGHHAELLKEFAARIPFIGNKTTVKMKQGKIELQLLPESRQFPHRSDWEITIIDTGIDSMTGSRLAQVRSYVDTAPAFCVTYGDTLSNVDLHDLLAFHSGHGKTGTLLAVHNPTRFRILGLAEDDDMIKGFSEKPVLERDYINGGFYIFNTSLFEMKTLSSASSCVFETAVLEELISHKQLMAYRYNGFWQSLDNERDRNKLAAYVRESA